jgi:hypothetical protein
MIDRVLDTDCDPPVAVQFNQNPGELQHVNALFWFRYMRRSSRRPLHSNTCAISVREFASARSLIFCDRPASVFVHTLT